MESTQLSPHQKNENGKLVDQRVRNEISLPHTESSLPLYALIHYFYGNISNSIIVDLPTFMH